MTVKKMWTVGVHYKDNARGQWSTDNEQEFLALVDQMQANFNRNVAIKVGDIKNPAAGFCMIKMNEVLSFEAREMPEDAVREQELSKQFGKLKLDRAEKELAQAMSPMVSVPAQAVAGAPKEAAPTPTLANAAENAGAASTEQPKEEAEPKAETEGFNPPAPAAQPKVIQGARTTGNRAA